MTDLGTPFWQNVLLYAGALFLLWETFVGWRRGLVRSALHFGAFVLSGFLGLLAGQAVAAMVGLVLPGLAFFCGFVVGGGLALTVLGVCLFASALVFKRTSQQPPGLMRWVFGIGGAFFGVLTGLFLLWGAISLIRTSGAIAQSGLAGKPASGAPSTVRTLAILKDSLELGPVGEFVERIDVLPTDTYDRLVKFGQLTNNTEAMLRFLEVPDVQKILAHPRMQALLNDPGIVSAAENKDIPALVKNPLLFQAATDPSLQKLVLSTDLQKALDYALPARKNPPSQSATP